MKQLNELIAKLNSDKLCAVDVFDNDTGKNVHKNFIHQDLVDQYQTAEEFFQNLLDSGYKNLTIQEKRKRGNSFQFFGSEFKIAPEQEVIEPKKSVMEETKMKKKKKKKKKSSKGLNMGLGLNDMITLHTKADKLEETIAELKEFKSENKKLKQKNEDLREELLLKKYTKENNDSRNNAIIKGLNMAPAILNGMGFKIPVPSGGLAGNIEDAEIEQYTELESNLVQIIKENDDSSNEILLGLLNKINSGDEAFAKQFFAFLIKTKLVEAQ